MIPHSHEDAGWVKTLDEYYQGTNSASGDPVHASVRNILDTVINQLEAASSRKSTYVEMAFFTKWYNS